MRIKTMNSKLRKFLAGTFAAAAVGGFSIGCYELQNTVSPASAGITYLNNHGFTDVRTTKQSIWTHCRKGESQRSYLGTRNGVRKKEMLCFSSFHHIRH